MDFMDARRSGRMEGDDMTTDKPMTVEALIALGSVVGDDDPQCWSGELAFDADVLRAAIEQYGKEQYARGVNDAWPAGRGSGEPVGRVFGIIDPDYARVFTHARIVAWQYGYACLAHGSFTRDLDLLLVPWTDKAQSKDVDYFAPRIAEAAGLKVHHGPPSVRPHGRKTWTLTFPGFADPRWVDLSVLLPQAAPQPPHEPVMWLPMDTAPKDGRRILLWWGDRVVYGHWLDNLQTSVPWSGWRGPSLEPMRTGQPSHWMPLPGSPNAVPQPREPLTNEQIDSAIAEHVDPVATYGRLVAFARAIERAHGIMSEG